MELPRFVPGRCLIGNTRQRILLFVSFLVANSPLLAGTYYITNTNSSGPGSLRQAFFDAYPISDDHLFIFSGIGGEIVLPSNVGYHPGRITYDTTLALSPISVRGNNHYNVNYLDFENTSISGNQLVVGGVGKTILHRANSYAGGTKIMGTTLQIDADNNLGEESGGIELQGTLSLAKGINSSRNISLSAMEGTIDTQQYTSTFTGTITGGTIIKEGSGVLALSGSNNLSGVTVKAGTLRMGAANLFGPFFLLNLYKSSVFDLNGFNQTVTAIGESYAESTSILLGTATLRIGNGSFTGTISGSGKLVKIGESDLVLSGTSTFTGGTTVAAGKLIGNTHSLVGAIANSGSLIFSQSFDGEFNGVISGTGSVVIEDGNLRFTGKNTYSGGTSVHNGVLVIDSKENLGDSIGRLQLQQSALDLRDACHIQNDVELPLGGAITVNEFTSRFSGSMSGDFLNKYGTGTMVLEGQTNFSDYLGVFEGTLKMGRDNILSSNTGIYTDRGTIVDFDDKDQSFLWLVNNGTAHLGGATINTQSYTGGGTLSTTLISNNVYGRINASDYVSIAGGSKLRLFVFGSFIPQPQQTFRIISAPKVYGEFASFEFPSALKFSLHYSSQSVDAVFEAINYGAAASVPNRKRIANVLDELNNNASGDLQNVLGVINSLQEPGFSSALDQLSPISLVSMVGLEASGAKAHIASVQRRFFGLHDGEESDHFSIYDTRASKPAITMVAAGGMADYNEMRSTSRKSGSNPWGYFGSIGGSKGRLDSIDGELGLQPGYNFATNGFNLGIDRRVSKSLVFGLTGGFSSGKSDLDFDQGSAEVESLLLGFYATHYKENGVYIDAYLGGSRDFYETKRNIPFIGRTATGDPNGTSLNGALQVGVDRKVGKGKLSPVITLEYNRTHVDAYSEDGAGSLNLHIEDQTASSFLSIIGGRFSRNYTKGATILTPSINLGWEHEFLSGERSIGAQFNAGGSAFAVKTSQAGKDAALLNLGFAAHFSPRFGCNIGYQTELARTNLNSQTIDGRVYWRF